MDIQNKSFLKKLRIFQKYIFDIGSRYEPRSPQGTASSIPGCGCVSAPKLQECFLGILIVLLKNFLKFRIPASNSYQLLQELKKQLVFIYATIPAHIPNSERKNRDLSFLKCFVTITWLLSGKWFYTLSTILVKIAHNIIVSDLFLLILWWRVTTNVIVRNPVSETLIKIAHNITFSDHFLLILWWRVTAIVTVQSPVRKTLLL